MNNEELQKLLDGCDCGGTGCLDCALATEIIRVRHERDELREALLDAANRLEAAAQNAECGLRLNHTPLARWANDARAALAKWGA